jgi:hypothetical protein
VKHPAQLQAMMDRIAQKLTTMQVRDISV